MKSFNEVFEDKTKYGTKIKTSEYCEMGAHLIIDQGQEQVAGYTDIEEGVFEEVPVIIFGDHTRVIKYVDKPFFLGADGVKVLRSKFKNANYKYLYYALKNARIPNTGYNRHFKWLKEVQIEYPDYRRQENVVKILDKVSDLIETRQHEIKRLDDLIKARFVEMFGNESKRVAVSSVCDVSGGYSFKSGDISSNGVVKILQIGNVYLDDLNWETTNYLPEGFDYAYSGFLLNEGDVVIALTRPIIKALGNVKACIVKESDMPCLLNQRVGRIVPKQNVDVSMKFVYRCFMTNDFTRYVESCCIGCSQPNISTKDIENYMIPDVSYAEQMAFVKFIDRIDKSKVAVQKALDETQTLFDSLMQEYFG